MVYRALLTSYVRAFTLAALSYLALHGHHVEPMHVHHNDRRSLGAITR